MSADTWLTQMVRIRVRCAASTRRAQWPTDGEPLHKKIGQMYPAPSVRATPLAVRGFAPAAPLWDSDASCRSIRRRHVCLSDCLEASPLDHRGGATGGHALVRLAGCRDQADIRVFLSRHERQSKCAHIPSTLSAMRSTWRHSPSPDGRTVTVKNGSHGLRGGAGFSPRRAGGCLRCVHHCACAGFERLPLRPHPRGLDAARQRVPDMQSARDVGRGVRGARWREICCPSQQRAFGDRSAHAAPFRAHGSPGERASRPRSAPGPTRRGRRGLTKK